MARTLAKNLERAGHAVDARAARAGGARAPRRRRPSTSSLTDLKMPVMDGMQLLRAMHERGLRRRGRRAHRLRHHRERGRGDEARRRRLPDQGRAPAGDPPHASSACSGSTRSPRERAPARARSGRFAGFGELIGESAADAGDLPADRRGRREQEHGAGLRRERHRQGARRAHHPRARTARAAARSSPSTARACPRRCSTASSSATGAAPSPARSATTTASSAPRRAARSSSTRCPRFPLVAAGQVPARHPGARGDAARLDACRSRSTCA